MAKFVVTVAAALFTILPGTALAGATTVTEHVTIPLAFQDSDPCSATGEVITFSGTLRGVLHFTQTESGSILVLNGTDILEGIGDLGTRYHAIDHGLSLSSGWAQGADQTITVQNSVFLSTDFKPNFVGHLTFRFTITPSGDITGVVDDFSFECVPEAAV